MENWDLYKSVSAPAEGLYKDKGSRFIAYVYPLDSESRIKSVLDAVRKEHHSARHCCYAYRLGYDGKLFRANDDGEPSGTAGRQILGAIDSAGLSDVLVVVVRYFGGILLGVPGLIRAYREAASDALSKAVKVEKIATEPYGLRFAYSEMETVQRFLKQKKIAVREQKFDLECEVEIDLRLAYKNDFIEELNNINNEKCTCIQCRPLQVA